MSGTSIIAQFSMPLSKEFLAIRRAVSLNETFVLFVEITTGETRHIQQVYMGHYQKMEESRKTKS